MSRKTSKARKQKLHREASQRWRKAHPEQAKAVGLRSYYKNIATSVQYRKKNKHRRAAVTFKYRVGISYEDRDAILVGQGNVCAICGTPGTKWTVDHCHTTKIIRGVLCRLCNLGLGHFRDNPKILAAAIRYLKQKGHQT
jgi:hypothetical protein